MRNKMKYINFMGTKISKLSLGTVQFGLEYGIANEDGKLTQKNVNKIIDYVVQNGINCFDTAPLYGNSEEVLGKALSPDCEKYIISKISSSLFKNSAKSSVENSLKNLNINSLFALLLHDSTQLYDWNTEDSKVVETLIKEKKIKYFGVSIYTSKDFELAIENDKIDIIQIPFNIFDQRAIQENWLTKAKEKNKLVFIRSIYLQGLFLLDRAKIPQQLKKAHPYLDLLQDYATKLNINKNQLALSFVNTVAGDALLLFGCDNLKQAQENILNYNNLIDLDDTIIKKMQQSFKNIDEEIYNPLRWLEWQKK